MSHFVIHTTENCPYCRIVKDILTSYEYEYRVVYEKSPEWPTYPCVYLVDDTLSPSMCLIGGASELQSFLTTYNKDMLKNQADG